MTAVPGVDWNEPLDGSAREQLQALHAALDLRERHFVARAFVVEPAQLRVRHVAAPRYLFCRIP